MNRRELLAIVIVCLVAGVIRCVGLLEPSIWFDEAMSWRTSTLPWDAMLRSIGRNTHPPLYFVVLKLWMGVWGESLLALRSLNVLVAVLTVPFVWLFVREATRIDRHNNFENDRIHRHCQDRSNFMHHVPLVACILFAVSPFQIRLAWEVRMYPLLVLLAAVSSWLLMRAMAKPQVIGRWIGFSIASLAMLYTQYFGLFAFAGQVVFLVWWVSRRDGPSRRLKLRSTLVAATLMATGWAFWMPTFLRQRQRVASGWWTDELTFDKMLETVTDLVASSSILSNEFATMICFVAFASVLMLLSRMSSLLPRYLMIIIVASTMLPIACSLVGTNVIVSRYFAITQLFWLAGLACVISSTRLVVPRYALVAAASVTFLLLHSWHLQALHLDASPGVRRAIGFIEAHSDASDQVIAESTLCYLPAQFHSRNRDQLRVSNETEQAAYFTGSPVLRVPERIKFADVPASCQGIWLVSRHATPTVAPSRADWSFGSCHIFPGTAPFQETTSVTRYTRRVNETAGASQVESVLARGQ